MLFQKFFPLNTQNHFGIVLYTTFEGLVEREGKPSNVV